MSQTTLLGKPAVAPGRLADWLQWHRHPHVFDNSYSHDLGEGIMRSTGHHIRGLLLGSIVYGLAASSTASLTAAEPNSAPKAKVKAVTGDLLGFGAAGQTASDLRKAAEIVEHMQPLILELTPIVAKALTDVTNNLARISENLAKVSSGFDPLGQKAAFEAISAQNEIIREQQALIQKLQQAEIDRLRQEVQSLKQQLSSSPPLVISPAAGVEAAATGPSIP